MDKRLFSEFLWMNESKATFSDGRITILAPEKCDFFFNNNTSSENGITPDNLSNAPFLFTEVSGDFVLTVKVIVDFKDTYDAAAVMVMKNDHVWVKSCFEKTDFGTNAVVSVVMNQVTDDANGCNIDGNSVWLKVVRIGQSFALHYSQDGKSFNMTRVFSLPVDDIVKVGLVAQAPIGNGGERHFEHLVLERKTLDNIRFA
ncbi:DUF1349 domain-containing protein [Obesumbacterium proteus]|uniref:DUF1349 domain-containing protein n=1 Tax=Obesumbacterium proteus ATCC 12841 TaxID=1354268 RepID=A0AA91EJS0_9GAMM|nr:DUF1349 domain-containing protein [Obesumbacterium proteus]AMO79670.1 hypothetical protein DSM2777_00480 [Obesumbacterium proteus]OAT58926.1 hypothetical protein M993_02229 [Obesumbacterium proteus ATCC 12841]